MKIQIKKELQIIKLTLLIVILFLICWIPLSTYGLIVAINKKKNTKATKLIEDLLFLIAILNSLLNPILYVHHYRREIMKYIRICCTSKQNKENDNELIIEDNSVVSNMNIRTSSNI